VRERGRQVTQKMWRVEQENDAIGIFYYTQGLQQEGTAENTSVEPSYWPGWLSRPGARLSKTARTWVVVSARMYNDSNSLGNRAKEGRRSKGRHAGTGQRISARIHVANSHANRAEDRRTSDRRHSANSLWERDDSCMTVGTSIVVAYAGGRGEGVSLSTGVKGSTEVGN